MDWLKDIQGIGANPAFPHMTPYEDRLETQRLPFFKEVKTIFNATEEQSRAGIRRFGASPAADTVLNLFRTARETGTVPYDLPAFWELCEEKLAPHVWTNMFTDAMWLSDRAFVAGIRLSITDAYNIVLTSLIDNTSAGFITEQRGLAFLQNYKKDIAWAWVTPVQDRLLGGDLLGVKLLPNGVLQTVIVSFKAPSYVPGLSNRVKVSPALKKNRHKEHLKHLRVLGANPDVEIWIVYESQGAWAVMNAADVPCPECQK